MRTSCPPRLRSNCLRPLARLRWIRNRFQIPRWSGLLALLPILGLLVGQSGAERLRAAAEIPDVQAGPAAVAHLSASPAGDSGEEAGAYAVQVEANLAYVIGAGADPRHRLDLYRPQGLERYPMLLFVIGGDWTSGGRADFAAVGQSLASRGLGVAVVEHRLSAGAAAVRHPAHAQDVASALAWLRTRMLVDGLDPDALYLMGYDSGAHLAALLAANPRFVHEHGLDPGELRGVIGLSDTYRVDPAGRDRPEVFGLDPMVRLDASPFHNVTGAVPEMLLIHAERDLAGRQREADALAEKLVAAGAEVQRARIADRDFAGLIFDFENPASETVERVWGFVMAREPAEPTPSASPEPSPTFEPSPTPRPVHPPVPPRKGPGSSADRPYAEVKESLHEAGALRYWRFAPADLEPAGADPVEPLSLVVFVPAAGPTDPFDPDAYRAWLHHLATGGNVVVYPVYTGIGLAPEAWMQRLSNTVGLALADLRADDTLSSRIDLSSMTVAGHGRGATLAANLAADWFALRLPLPRGVMLMMPRDPDAVLMDPKRLAHMPADAKLLFVEGTDTLGYDRDFEIELWDRSASAPIDWRSRLLLQGDAYGTPALEASFQAPYTGSFHGATDGFDWYGTWKWLDGLIDCTFRGEHCAYAFGAGSEFGRDHEQQIFMGFWSDGRMVKPALASDGPPRPPTWRLLLPYVDKRGPALR